MPADPSASRARQSGPGGDGPILPDTTISIGTVTFMSWKSPAAIIVSVPDTLVFLYIPQNAAAADSVARRENLRGLINGSYFSGVRGDAKHAGLLAMYGRVISPETPDRQLTHIVRINGAARTVEFFPAGSFTPGRDPHTVEFQSGPLLIEGGIVREDLVRSSINGSGSHARTLLATLDHTKCYFVSVTERVTLGELGAWLRRLSVFQGEDWT